MPWLPCVSASARESPQLWKNGTEGVGSMKQHYPLFINGEFVESSSGEVIETFNPATGEVIGTVAKANREDVDKAVAAARAAFEQGKWPKMNAARRAKIMIKIAGIMTERLPELIKAEVLNSGKTVSAAKGRSVKR